LPIGLPGLLVLEQEQEQEQEKVEDTAPERRTARTVSRSSVTNMNSNRSASFPASKEVSVARTVASRFNQSQSTSNRGGDNSAKIGLHNDGDCAPVRMTQPQWNGSGSGNGRNNRVGSESGVQKIGNLNGSENIRNNGIRQHAVNNSSKRTHTSTSNSQKSGKQVTDLLDGIRSKPSSAQTQRARLQDRELRPVTNTNNETNQHGNVITPPVVVALPKYKAFILDHTYASAQMLTMGGSRLGGFVKSDYEKIENISLPEKAVRISEALENLEIDGIIATGDNGSMEKISGLLDQMKYIVDVETGERVKPIPFVGIPKTIDNDIPSTIYSLGFQSAVSRAATAIAEVRNTAESHRRIMVVECMGRDAGFLTLHAGMAGGADTILLPEFYMDETALLSHVAEVYNENGYAVVAVSEAITMPLTGRISKKRTPDGVLRLGGSAEALASFLSRKLDVDARHVVLGHVQRGATPNAFDQVMATTLGAHAVQKICEKAKNARRDGELEGDQKEELTAAAAKGSIEGGSFLKWNGTHVENVPLAEISDVRSRKVTVDYPELIAAQAMGIYCGNVMP